MIRLNSSYKQIALSFIALFIFSTSCSVTNKDNTAAQTGISAQIFSNSINEFIVKVVFEIGATPYTGYIIGISGNDTWDITKSSYQSLFQNHTGRTITVPKTVPGFTQIADQNKTSWTSAELISLGTSVAPALAIENGKATMTVIFVNGLYNGSNQTLGIHFTGYPFAFIFKDVVTSVGGTTADRIYVEQATVVHELGHVVGFVNNGVPLTTNHEDQTHAKHSTNTNCVMYWAVESSSSILGSLANSIFANRLNLFGTEVLADAQAYHP